MMLNYHCAPLKQLVWGKALFSGTPHKNVGLSDDIGQKLVLNVLEQLYKLVN